MTIETVIQGVQKDVTDLTASRARLEGLPTSDPKRSGLLGVSNRLLGAQNMLNSLTQEGPEQGATALAMLESLKANINRKLQAIEKGRGKPEERDDQQKYLVDAESKIAAVKAAFPNAEKANPGLWLVMPSDQSE